MRFSRRHYSFDQLPLVVFRFVLWATWYLPRSAVRWRNHPMLFSEQSFISRLPSTLKYWKRFGIVRQIDSFCVTDNEQKVIVHGVVEGRKRIVCEEVGKLYVHLYQLFPLFTQQPKIFFEFLDPRKHVTDRLSFCCFVVNWSGCYHLPAFVRHVQVRTTRTTTLLPCAHRTYPRICFAVRSIKHRRTIWFGQIAHRIVRTIWFGQIAHRIVRTIWFEQIAQRIVPSIRRRSNFKSLTVVLKTVQSSARWYTCRSCCFSFMTLIFNWILLVIMVRGRVRDRIVRRMSFSVRAFFTLCGLKGIACRSASERSSLCAVLKASHVATILLIFHTICRNFLNIFVFGCRLFSFRFQ